MSAFIEKFKQVEIHKNAKDFLFCQYYPSIRDFTLNNGWWNKDKNYFRWNTRDHQDRWKIFKNNDTIKYLFNFPIPLYDYKIIGKRKIQFKYGNIEITEYGEDNFDYLKNYNLYLIFLEQQDKEGNIIPRYCLMQGRKKRTPSGQFVHQGSAVTIGNIGGNRK